jgi:hypothetical protein
MHASADARGREAGFDPSHLNCIPPNAFTISLAICAGEPGVENMLGHAPPPLAASGLDMRDGHPARSR